MCEFVRIASHFNYQVSRCCSCYALEIVVGTCIIHMSPNQWCSFLQYVDRVKNTHASANIYLKSIMLDIAGTETFQMYLSVHELNEFSTLLEKADDEMKALELLNYFSPGK